MDILEDSVFLKPLDPGTLIITAMGTHDEQGFHPETYYAEDPKAHMAAIKPFVDPYGPFYQGLAMWHECDNQERWEWENYDSDKSIEEWAELEDIEAEGCFGPSLVALEEEAWDLFVFELFCQEGFEPADFDDEVK